jgi:NADPH:quinone reductase-like Zn-dependent oxidoreductase
MLSGCHGPWGAGAASASSQRVMNHAECVIRVVHPRPAPGPVRGQTLLILGAGGSAGTIATQLAVARGLTVVGTASPDGVGAVFDTTGAGLLAGAVSLAGGPARVITIADPDAAVHQVRFTGADPADRAPEALPELARLMAAGPLTVPVWRGYPLAEAAAAHADLEAGRNHGKIVLRP